MNIFEEAVDFAKKIQATEEFLNLKKAKEINDSDETLQGLIGEFNLLKMKRNYENGNDDEDKKNSLKLSELYDKIMANENMIKFNEASEKMNSLMNRVNRILVAAVNNEDFENFENFDESENGCNGHCNGCSGCF